MRMQAVSAAVIAVAAGSALADSFHDLPSFLTATANEQLINFDTTAAGAPFAGGDAEIGSAYAAWGLTFPRGNRSVNFFGGPVSPPRGWLNDTQSGSDRIFDVDITRDDITAVGVHNVFFGGTPAGSTIAAYGAGGVLLESTTSNAVPETLDFFGVSTSAPIKRVIVTVRDAGGWGLDDLYVAQIPTPASAALLGLGVLAAGRRRR